MPLEVTRHTPGNTRSQASGREYRATWAHPIPSAPFAPLTGYKKRVWLKSSPTFAGLTGMLILVRYAVTIYGKVFDRSLT
jgi:hypothetical protein